MPKVLLVLPSTVIGGAETKTFNLIHSLDGFYKVLVTHSPISGFFSELGIKTYILEDFDCSNPYSLSPVNIFTYANAIKKISGIETPDIVLGIMHYGALFVTASKTMSFLKYRPVITIEGNISAYFNSINRQATFKERLLLKYCFKKAEGTIVPSEGVREDIINKYGAIRKKTVTIYNGIDIEKIRESAKAAIPHKKDCPWIVTACRLNSQKDFSTLLKAFCLIRKIVNAKLFIVGEGELRNDIIRLASELKINNDVIITGFLRNPFPYIAKADVFVLSSFFEGFGNVLVEAMALGIPVVSTDCPSGPSEIINNGVNGFLVPVEGVKEMDYKCMEILTNADIRRHISNNGKIRAEDFSIYTMGKKFGEYFMNLLRT
jgi:glycosyltransferase involved in cell wall biosynthesis